MHSVKMQVKHYNCHVWIYSVWTLEFLLLNPPVCALALPRVEDPRSVWLVRPLTPTALTLRGANGPRCDVKSRGHTDVEGWLQPPLCIFKYPCVHQLCAASDIRKRCTDAEGFLNMSHWVDAFCNTVQYICVNAQTLQCTHMLNKKVYPWRCTKRDAWNALCLCVEKGQEDRFRDYFDQKQRLLRFCFMQGKTKISRPFFTCQSTEIYLFCIVWWLRIETVIFLFLTKHI